MAGVDYQEGWLPWFATLGDGRIGSSGTTLWMASLGLALIWGCLEEVGVTEQKVSPLRIVSFGLRWH